MKTIHKITSSRQETRFIYLNLSKATGIVTDEKLKLQKLKLSIKLFSKKVTQRRTTINSTEKKKKAAEGWGHLPAKWLREFPMIPYVNSL